MIRLLLIGRLARDWAQRMRDTGVQRLEMEVARLPAEGVRKLEATPPDAVLIIDDRGGPHARMLVSALRERPIGPLLTVLLLSVPPVGVSPEEIPQQLNINAWFPLDVEPAEVIRALARALDIPFDELTTHTPAQPTRNTREVPALGAAPAQPYTTPSRPQPPAQPAPQPATQARRAPQPAPSVPFSAASDRPVSHIHRSEIFPARARREAPAAVDAETIRRKLREVRHEDYFTILELRRGAEGPVVREAYRRMAARFHPDALDFELARAFQDDLEEILDALEDAWAVLGDASLREAYISHAPGLKPS